MRSSHIDPATWRDFQGVLDNYRKDNVAPKPKRILSACKKVISGRYAQDWESHLSTLTVQNRLADILPLGKEDHLWLRLLTGMPAGQLSFVLRASTECLPSPSTLARWGFSLSKKCPLCESSTCTAHHVLNSCPSSLADGRYTWRHDQVLMKLLPFIKRHNPTAAVFADIPNHRACESPPATIPVELSTTTARPDIVLHKGKSVILLELTIPWNSVASITSAKARKENKTSYQLLISDLTNSGYSVHYTTIEIGCLGHYTSDAYASLKTIAPSSSRASRRDTLLAASKAAISCSYHIFSCRGSKPWLLS